MSEMRLRGVSAVVLTPAAAGAAALGGLGYLAGVLGGPVGLALAVAQCLLVLAGACAAALVGSRRLRLCRGVLEFRSLSRRLIWPVARITAITYDGHPWQSWHAHICLHDVDGGCLALNVYLWHQRELAALVQGLLAVNPAIRTTPATRGYLAVAP